MSSLLTNASAMTALTTLKSIAGQLDQTSARISTGLKVNDASDNAAYWSIATTIRADNGSLGAVKDALGLGANSVDTAFNGMNRSIELMKDIQAKLTAAMSPNVDRAKIQTEIDAKLKELKQTSDASVVSGENWLSTDSGAGNYVSDRKIVASFSRIDGAVSVDTVNISVDSTKLYDKSTTASAITGQAADVTTAETNFTTAKTAWTTAVTTWESSIKDAAARTALDTAKTNIDTARGTYGAAMKAEGAAADAYIDADKYMFGIAEDTWAAAETAWESSDKGAAAKTTYDTAKAAFDAAKDTYATGIETANGLANAQNDGEGGILNKEISVLAKNEDGAQVAYELSLDKLDISAIQNQDLSKLRAYIQVVDKALGAMTDAATTLGANKTQITSQTTFVESLIKANERSIGTLVDADMEEESTRLKALQVQQQLGVQALSIANSSTQGILSLFQG